VTKCNISYFKAIKMTFMLPGDSIDLDSNITELLIGPGFRKDEKKLIATKCGILKKKENFSYWIESSQKRVREEVFNFT
jgi:hypothetical protein